MRKATPPIAISLTAGRLAAIWNQNEAFKIRKATVKSDSQRETTALLVNQEIDRESTSISDGEGLTYKNAFFELSKITGPTALITIFYAINGFIMSLSFSELGHTELAAAGLITAGQLLIYNSFSGAGRSSGVLISGKHKENDHKAVTDLFHHSLLYSTILGLVSTAAILALPYFFSAIFLVLLNNLMLVYHPFCNLHLT